MYSITTFVPVTEESDDETDDQGIVDMIHRCELMQGQKFTAAQFVDMVNYGGKYTITEAYATEKLDDIVSKGGYKGNIVDRVTMTKLLISKKYEVSW
jgi:hypothetical protein